MNLGFRMILDDEFGWKMSCAFLKLLLQW